MVKTVNGRNIDALAVVSLLLVGTIAFLAGCIESGTEELDLVVTAGAGVWHPW